MTAGLKYRREQIISELQFETSRSSGAGGQHVNKTESRVTAVFYLLESSCFSEKEKELLSLKLRSKLNKGVLRISSQDTRSQHRNKEFATERLLEMLAEGLIVAKRRKKTKMSKAQKERRFKNKKKRSETKNLRKKIRKSDY